MSNNVEIFKDSDDTITYDTAYCPICGSTEILCDVMVTTSQDAEGSWMVLPIDEVVMHHAITNNNTEVRCDNPSCGTPSCGIFDAPVDLNDVEESYRQYAAEYENHYNPEEPVLPMDEWQSYWTYTPWSGVYGDTVDAQGRQMSSKD